MLPPSEPEEVGSFTAPSTWQEMTRALLDLLMPANSIDECARQIAIFFPELCWNRMSIRDGIPYNPIAVPGRRRPCR